MYSPDRPSPAPPLSRASLVIGLYAAMALVGLLVAAGRGDPNVFVFGTVPRWLLAAGPRWDADQWVSALRSTVWLSVVAAVVCTLAAIPLGVLDCTPTRLVLGGAPAGTTGAHFLKITDAGDHFTTWDQELTAA